MVKLLLYQPFKSLYTLYFFADLLLFKVPLWLIYYSRHANRPRSSWTLTRSVLVRVIRAVVALPQKVGVSNRDLSRDVPQWELMWFNARFVRVNGMEDSEVVGEIRDFAEQAGVQPVSVPCFWLRRGIKWIPEHEKAGEDEKVILHIHGGAFLVSPSQLYL